MKLQQLFEALAARSLSVRLRSDHALEVVGDVSRLTEEIKGGLRLNREAFLALLAPAKDSLGGCPFSGRIRLGAESFAFDLWQRSERLRSPIAIDTETELIDGNRVPRLALVSVSDGNLHRLLKPDELQAFVDSHHESEFIAHNAPFDFAVIRQALRDPERWVAVADEGRLHDTMILDALIRLAQADEYPRNRDLGTLARIFLGVVIDKEDPFRLRYAELIGKPWEEADPGFFSYAIKDAIATRKLWDRLSKIARSLIAPFADELISGAVDRFGPLTESLQVRGAIALGDIERKGLALDQIQVETTKRKLREEVDRLIEEISVLPESDGLFKRSRSGSLVLTASGKPAVNQKKLRTILEGYAQELALEDVPRTGKTDAITCSFKYWGQHAEGSLFLSLWGRLEEVAKLSQFFGGLKSDRVFPKYTPIVRTGRTACSSPNVQQLPRTGGFREMIVPSPGFVFLGIDYAAIELRTLAAVCERRFGRSRLAEVIREGIDPHAFTASLFEGVTVDEFDQLPNRKTLRQRAKALNFGIPGGLGAKSLVAYAAATYGVSLSIDQASQFRERLISEVYPELSRYLEDDPIGSLAHNLKTSAFRVRSCFETDGSIGAVKRIVAGKGKASGDEYSEGFVNRVWDSLASLNNDERLGDQIRGRKGSEALSRALFFSPVVTITGRLRGRVGFSQARNTPFSGLAADGAKLALWGLYREGFRTVAFVHDEALIELPVDADHTAAAKRIDAILCDSMKSLTGSVPIETEFALSDRWYKAAEAVFDDQGKLRLWKPTP
jgi:DNA polymerase I-like protein with 3'-5' exonuclease and polymerase domains